MKPILRLGGNTFGLMVYDRGNWWFRVFRRGISMQPLDKNHMHLYTTRHAKVQPIHAYGHCFKVLK